MFGVPALYLKLAGGLVALLVLAGLVLGLRHYKSLAERRGAELATICQTTRLAADQPKLKCGDVAKQIELMGEAVSTLKGALADQNAKVGELARESAAEQAQSRQALKSAVSRAQAAEATSEVLSASSRSGERLAKPCEASKALEESWK